MVVAVGDGGGGLVDDVDHLEPRDSPGFDAAFPLEVPEIDRDGDDQVLDEADLGLLLGQALEPLQDLDQNGFREVLLPVQPYLSP